MATHTETSRAAALSIILEDKIRPLIYKTTRWNKNMKCYEIVLDCQDPHESYMIWIFRKTIVLVACLSATARFPLLKIANSCVSYKEFGKSRDIEELIDIIQSFAHLR